MLARSLARFTWILLWSAQNFHSNNTIIKMMLMINDPIRTDDNFISVSRHSNDKIHANISVGLYFSDRFTIMMPHNYHYTCLVWTKIFSIFAGSALKIVTFQRQAEKRNRSNDERSVTRRIQNILVFICVFHTIHTTWSILCGRFYELM